MVARIPVNNTMAWNEVWSALFHFWRERTSCIKPIKWTLQLSKLKKKNRIHPHYGGVVRCLCPQSAITAKKTTRKEIECSAIVMRALLNKRTSWLKGNNFSHRITCDMNFERWKLYTIPIVLKCSFKYFPHIVCVCVFFFIPCPLSHGWIAGRLQTLWAFFQCRYHCNIGLPTRKSTCSFHGLVTRAVVLFRVVQRRANNTPTTSI